ncbi:MAG: hypothetical protein SOT69_04300 [Mesosutterella sp.]|nr:hypothetical protein [Mesosutterella sp.]
MITLKTLLPAGSKPAPVLLARLPRIFLTSAQREDLPETFESDGEQYAVAEKNLRPLEVDDIFLDDKGRLIAVGAAPERVFHVTGDLDLLRQAAVALMMRGTRVSQTEDGFGIAADDDLKLAFDQIGLACTEVTEPFTPVPLPKHHHGCCCHDDDGCGCGHHHHDEDGDECCCGHHHHDEDGEECSCGHHHHHDEDGDECCCGHHHHDEDGDECCCGRHHHDEDGGECCCGHHHGEGEKASN